MVELTCVLLKSMRLRWLARHFSAFEILLCIHCSSKLHGRKGTGMEHDKEFACKIIEN